MDTMPTSGSMMKQPSLGGSSLTPSGSSTIDLQSSQTQKLNWFHNDFRPHFDEWVIGPINRLVCTRDALIGFIFMACAIDYLAGFRWGKSTKGEVETAYTDFVNAYFPSGRYDAKALYDSLRNGLVHMFTIKNKKYALTHNKPHLHLKTDQNGQIILNAGDFRDDLIAAKERYFDDVEAQSDLLNKALERHSRDGFLDLDSL